MKLAIVYITSWSNLSFGAEHLYAKFIISKDFDISIKDLPEWNIESFRDYERLERKLTLREAKLLDRKDGGHMYERSVKIGGGFSDRFNNEDQIEKAAISKYKELKLTCPLVMMYDSHIIKIIEDNN